MASALRKLEQVILGEYRTRPMARFTFFVLAYGLVLATVSYGGARIGSLWRMIFWLALVVAAGYYLLRFIGFIRHRVLWRLRWRLIVTYVFIAFVPILLIVLLVVIGAFIINGQFAVFLVTQRLRNHFDELEQVNRVVVHEVHQGSRMKPSQLLDHLQEFYATELNRHAASYPGLEITLRLDGTSRAFRLDGAALAKPVEIPEWLTSEEFAGFVMEGNQLFLRAAARTPTPEGELLVVLSQPFSPELLDLVGQGIGPVGVLVTRRENSQATGTPSAPSPASPLSESEGEYLPVATLVSKSVELPAPAYFFDYKVYGASTLDPYLWGGRTEERVAEPVFVLATSRIVTLNRELFVTLGRYSRFYITIFIVVAVVFLVIEVFAMIIGVNLTRSMTRTVDLLYDATERVKRGEFSYRMGLPAGDQLTALGEAFDNMTASVERLLRESHEKSRLESEVEIAREVQRQLFPREVPRVPGLELLGICKPARGVSGDYYDFLRLGKDHVGLVVGDVSGKGISAALLMAAIQSSLHAQFFNGSAPDGAAPVSAAQVVSRLNRQLCESTPLEKYATFFYGVYDAPSRRLVYTNAGHLAPAVFRKHGIERLEVGGTVVGLFPEVAYQQAEILLEPGDLLLAFTDGMTEPENTYGEEYGEDRLFETIERARDSTPEELVEQIYHSISDWTGSPELQDDMTLIVARVVRR